MNAPVNISFVGNTFTASDATNSEPNSVLFQYQIIVTDSFDEPLSFNLSTSDGTAIAGEDYIAVDETFTFIPPVIEQNGSGTTIINSGDGGNNEINVGVADGATFITSDIIAVDLIADTDIEPTESFFLNITNSEGIEVDIARATGIIEGDENISNSDGEESGNIIELFRFRNTAFDTGTYIFVGETEKDQIIANPDLNRVFALEGDGAAAFTASSSEGENLEPFYRFQNNDILGTYIFVGEAERNDILENFSDSFSEEGIAFYAYGANTGLGTEFNRLQNTNNGTYLFAGSDETNAILSDSNLAETFNNQGVAFASLD